MKVFLFNLLQKERLLKKPLLLAVRYYSKNNNIEYLPIFYIPPYDVRKRNDAEKGFT